MKKDNSRELANRVVEQWDHHDRFRITEADKTAWDGDEPPQVIVARALLRVDAEYGCEVRDPHGTIWQHAAKLEEELQVYRQFRHPRVKKLLEAGNEFIIIGEHEPYYMDAYEMIRKNELRNGTWFEQDRIAFAAAQLSRRKFQGEHNE